MKAFPLVALLLLCSLAGAATLFHNCATLAANTYYLQNGVFTDAGGPCLNVNGDNITVDCAGFKIYGTDRTVDIAVNNSEGHANLTVINCTFSNFYAIFYEKKIPDNATYTNNYVNSSAYSIFAYNATNHYVNNLTVWSGGEVYLNNVTRFSITNSNFTNATQGAAGFSTYSVRAVSGSRGLTFDGSIVNEYEAGIYDFMTDAASNSNTVKNSAFKGSNGTRIDNGTSLSFYNNTVYNVSAYSLYLGRYATSSTVNVSYNNFSYAQSTDAFPCVHLENASGVSFNGNNLTSCGLGGVFFNSTAASQTFGSTSVAYNNISLTGFSTGDAITFQTSAYGIDANNSLNVSYNNISNVAGAIQVLSTRNSGQATISWNSFLGNNATNYTGVCTYLKAGFPDVVAAADSNASIDRNEWSNNYCEGASTTNRHYGLVVDCEALSTGSGSCTVWNNRLNYNTVKTARYPLYLYANTASGTANATVRNNYGYGNYFNNTVSGYALANFSCDTSGTTGDANVLENSVLDPNAPFSAVANVYVQRAGLNLTNSTHNKGGTGVATNGAFIIGLWYVNLRALRQDGVALANAKISMNDSTGAAVFYNLTTNATGDIAQQNVTEYYQDSHVVTNYTDPNGHWLNGSTLAYAGGAFKYINRFITRREDFSMYFGECGRIIQNTSLLDDQHVNGTCFNVTADNVVLDCKGHSIIGNFTPGESPGYGVATSKANVTITNCIIYGFYDGIHLDGATSTEIKTVNSSYNNNSALYMRASNASVTNSTFFNGSYGPEYSDFNLTTSNATVLNCSFNKSSVAFADASSNIVTKWFLDVLVLDETGYATIAGINVNVTSTVTGANETGLTEGNGHAWIQVREYAQNSATVSNLTPHNVTGFQQFFYGKDAATFRYGSQNNLSITRSGNATVSFVVCGNGYCSTGIEDCVNCPLDCNCRQNPPGLPIPSPAPSPTAKPTVQPKPSVQPTVQPTAVPEDHGASKNKTVSVNNRTMNATQTLNVTTQEEEIKQKCAEGEMQTYKVERTLTVIREDDGRVRTLVNLTVQNTGAKTLMEIAVDDQLPAGVAYSSVAFSRQPSLVEGNKIAWTVGSLAPGESTSFAYYADGELSLDQFGQAGANANETGTAAAMTFFNLDVSKWNATNYALAGTLGVEAIAGYWFIRRKRNKAAAKGTASQAEEKAKEENAPGAKKQKPQKKGK